MNAVELNGKSSLMPVRKSVVTIVGCPVGSLDRRMSLEIYPEEAPLREPEDYMRVCDIDPTERYLAFRCRCCDSQLAETVVVKAGTGELSCRWCQGPVRQLKQHEFIDDPIASYFPNPYFVAWYRRVFMRATKLLRGMV